MSDDSMTTIHRLDIGSVLTDIHGIRYLVLDMLGGKLKLVKIPVGMGPEDFGSRFHHDPEPGDPARCTLTRE
jgi:hypothetical protein